jgi:glycosyltransferase involved in cell wall biosynthesis
VIIPSYNKATELAISLPLLGAQTIHASDWHLIIIDDGSTDETCEVVKRYAVRRDLTLVSLDPAKRCASRARNVGVECATTPYILFLDPDILPSTGLVAAHLGQLKGRNNIVSLGYMYAVGLGQDVFHRTYGDAWDFTDVGATLRRASGLPGLFDTRWDWVDGADRFSLVPCPWAGGWTGNMGLSRRTFSEVGGFDECFVDRGMEDIDLSYRLHLAGAVFELNGDAAGFHYPHPKDHARTGEADSQNSFTLLKKYPRPEIELLKVVSCAKLNTVLPRIRSILPTNQVSAPLDLSAVVSALGGRAVNVCIAGTYPSSVVGIPIGAGTSVVKFTGLAASAEGDTNSMPLLGIATPFEAASFDVAIVVDSWVRDSVHRLGITERDSVLMS